MKTILTMISLLLALILSGCITPPGLGGSTLAETSLIQRDEPQVDPVTGQVIEGAGLEYKRKVKLKAGDKLEGSDNMSYSVNPDNTWNISVGQAGSADTTVRANSIVDAMAIQAEAFKEANKNTGRALSVIENLLGIKLSNEGDREASDSASKAALQKLFMDWVTKGTPPPIPIIPSQPGTTP